MKDGTALHAKQIDHGRSTIWLEVDGEEVTGRRTLATNEVVNVVRSQCSPELFQEFYRGYYFAVGQVSTLAAPNLDRIAEELKLK